MIKTFLFVCGLLLVAIPVIFMCFAAMPAMGLAGQILIFIVLFGLAGLTVVGLYWLFTHAQTRRIEAGKIHADNRAFFYRNSLVEFQPAPFGSFGTVSNVTNYAPRQDFKSEARQVETAELAVALPAAAAPTFAELLTQGEIGQPNRLILGYADNKLISGSWLDLYSSAIGGISGSGKTTTTRFLACQSALAGAKFIIIDPHANITDESLAATLAPLSAAFAFDPAIENREILAALWAARQELEKRIRNGKGQPFIVAVDEFSSLMRQPELARPLVSLLADIAQQGRKVGIYAMCIGQIWTASATGGTSDLRDSFASAYVHRMKRNQARLLLPTDEATQVEKLQAGHALLSKTNGDIISVSIPETTAADVQRVAGLLSAHSETRKSPGNRPEIARKSPEIILGDTALQSVISGRPALTAEDSRVFELFRSGKTVSQIIQEVHGLNSKAGANYQRKNEEVQAALRRAFGS